MHVKDLWSLKNKVILITGGEGKYGRCLTEALAEADGKVITASPFLDDGQKVAQAFKERGLDVTADYVDQADHESIITLKNKIRDKYGKLDVLVNCAVARPMKTYTSPLEDWEKSMKVNATGLFDITREMAELIAESGGGTIVNICSMMGMFGPDLSNYEGTGWDVPMPDYFFHKGGMFSLTRYLARILASKNIRVNSISPGGIFAGQHEQFLKNYTRKVPLGRLANNDDIKGAVVFLASQASSYITGENILMDGGMHC
ncbi:MAG: SDR family oxidoreductase [Planctomycetaceae bacterium]|nr:SDR family oxidoreductase [Planctomycetaceae bacterium]